MVMCSAMDSVVIPRPPALPLGPLASQHPLKDTPLPPPPPPPKPLISQMVQTEEETSISHITKDQKSEDKKEVCEEKTVFEERRITKKLIEKKITRNESLRSKMSYQSGNSQKSNGFRLRENGQNTLQSNFNDDAGSIYSIYKQKIDSMFESDTSTTNSNHNSVQAKIEKMFSDVAKDSGLLPNQIGVHTFSVDYLGSVPLQDKVTSLSGLQKPLRELYFSYKKVVRSKKVLSGKLEISSQGLKVQYQGQSGDLEQMNSFPSIAVWSAVKFVIHENNGNNLCYAFLPLITDPDNMDKQSLFKTLEEADKKYIANEQHSPLFAVVMRKIGVQKQLECHGFVCQTSEDAIVIAATLYKSLVNHMKHKERRLQNKNGITTCMSTTSSTIADKNGSLVPVRPPRRKRSSAASSICSDTNSLANISDTQPLLTGDKIRRKSTKTKRAPQVPIINKQQDFDAIIPYEEPIKLKENEEEQNVSKKEDNEEIQEIKPKSFSDKLNTYMSKEQKQITEEIKQMVTDTNKGLKRVQSIRKRNEEAIRKKENSGDIFTKVTIPRSGSFLNTGGLTRYKNKVSRNNESASGGSPLGFKEIFNELSLQEGLHSMDDILSVIIDPDGMSFNDLKPIYKEFLLKLALTLTKDEMYLKSKSIMRRQKKKLKRSASIKKSPHILVSGKFKRLKHIFQKGLKSKKSKKALERKSNPIPNEEHPDAKLPESSISTSSYDTRQFRTKEELAGKKTSYRKKSQGDLSNSRRRDRASTSEESDFFSLKRSNKYRNHGSNGNLLTLNHNRNSSSGYVSCSECSYDSDTCTCVSADKCYCSLGQRTNSGRRDDKCTCAEDPTLIFCDCDTDSCADSNKCYCQYGNQQITTNSRKSSRHSSCVTKHGQKHKKLCKKNSNTKSSKSLEYMSNPSEGYYEKLRSKQKYGSERVTSHYASKQSLDKKRRNSHIGVGSQYVGADFSMMAQQNIQMGLLGGKLSAMDYELLKLSRRDLEEALYRRGFSESIKDYWCETRGLAGVDSRGQRIQSAITTGACTEALSVKKSAEIAALFADMKLSQTTDITHLTPQGFDLNNITHSKNIYNTEKSLMAKYSKPNKGPPRPDSKLISLPKPPLPPPSYGRPSSLIKNKSKLYSAKNGLYTIQSQSDESRASSISGDERRSRSGNDLDRYGSRRNVSSNIEDSLGYLP
ncbi:hypothetical protein GWI33_000364 [Rhynchophorus ferrugineus]|uniref:PID domain-containing protein n=1 Tax=Rhynchophorus ferrugineus TaxID=354439 RepID=A0A834IM67_RHYFE|nr:hypothetical protein GWI33_000364 [Rhynchophorus ferrugineus]